MRQLVEYDLSNKTHRWLARKAGFDVPRCFVPRKLDREAKTKCLNCKKEMQLIRLKRERKYCSYRCAAFGREAARKRIPLQKDCALCGASFVTLREDKKYCSQRCYFRYMGGESPVGEAVSRRPSHWNRKDLNHNSIVEALEKIGCAVIDASTLGGGVPDLIVSYRGKWYVMEVKNRDNHYGRKGLNKNQKAWADAQKAPVFIVTSALEAVNLLQMVKP